MARFNRTGRKKRTDNLMENLDRFPFKTQLRVARGYYISLVGMDAAERTGRNGKE